MYSRLIIISNITLFQFCIYMSKKQLQKQIEVVAEEQKPDKEQKSKPDKEQVKKVVS
jgi:hypothetical protein